MHAKAATIRVGRGHLPAVRIILESGAVLSAATAFMLGFSIAKAITTAIIMAIYVQLTVSC